MKDPTLAGLMQKRIDDLIVMEGNELALAAEHKMRAAVCLTKAEKYAERRAGIEEALAANALPDESGLKPRRGRPPKVTNSGSIGQAVETKLPEP